MNLKTTLFIGALASVSAFAQAPAPAVQANPTPGCTATPAEIAANKKAVLAFFDPTADRLALADPTYKQHNPAFMKRSAAAGVSDYEEYKQAFSGAGRGGGGRGRGPAADGPRPPAGNQLEVVTAECDIVSVIHKRYVQDPTEAPGKFYEQFSFDVFRVKNGKLTEHWDGATIQAPPAGGAQGGGRGN
jgi:predicted SnoaL-like aldol condensation-catalyzing enzyme